MASRKTITRDMIIRKGSELIHLRGFHSTGLQDILSSAGIPKGSFYFYFKNKEDFGLAIIDHFTSVIGSLFVKFLKDENVSPLQRFENLTGFYESLFRKTGYSLGCPIGNLSLELSDGNELFRNKLNDSIKLLTGYIEECLTDAKRSGDISDAVDTAQTADFIFQGFEGAILHMKVRKNPEPLITFKNYIMKYLQVISSSEKNIQGV